MVLGSGWWLQSLYKRFEVNQQQATIASKARLEVLLSARTIINAQTNFVDNGNANKDRFGMNWAS